eukprot:TRINITY_DN43779_c0_g1_i1.p1 TRINITY_DN43779_c0_g1~~TRINITY_DN43779_c0_g1_i1.p1  ORF type:complete len:337 (-),score=56.19 TRINITY_DN43779_c0_g1_i1:53-991(-)
MTDTNDAAEAPSVVAFCGLGAMGYHMAGHMASKLSGKCMVWNRTFEKAQKHATEHGTIATENLDGVAQAQVIVLCLPTSAEDAIVVETLSPLLQPGSCVISCTSGEPGETRRIATKLFEEARVHFVDCPVSGGPAGAKAATLTCMLGADDKDALNRCLPVIETFAGKVVCTGPTGSGHAVKAINNVLNVTHLMIAAEGLLALQKIGVEPEVALSVINSSSGRSLQTQERLPKEVLSRNFAYGFRLPLMAKDARIAAGVLGEGFPGATLLPAAAQLVQQAAAEETDEADYTRAVCLLERAAGTELRSKGSVEC